MSEDLQFDRAEMSTPTGLACRQCQTPLRGHYFQANGVMLCEACVGTLRNALDGQGTSAGRFLRAALLGSGAALLGGIGYGLFVLLTNYQFALITIAIGWFVGTAVRRGSGGRGGWRYGLLAVILTYGALALSYAEVGLVQLSKEPKTAVVQNEGKSSAPADIPTKGSGTLARKNSETARNSQPMSGGLAILSIFGMALALPVVAAIESPLSGLISGFGLWQAWKMNRAVQLEITGPHAIGEAPPSPGA